MVKRQRLLFVRVALVACMVTSVTATAGAQGGEDFPLGSTLEGKSVLPHRIRWLGEPVLPAGKVAAVVFLIDGRVRWVEHNPPYPYGYDGNYLVTSWLAPGAHRFTVRATAKDGRRATNSTVAGVSAPTAPPRQLIGRWTRIVPSGPAGGTWRLEVDEVGWRFRGPGVGAFVDVAYLAAGLLEARGGIHTRNRSEQEGNSWCNEPFRAVRYRWAVEGDTLALKRAGESRCDGQHEVWAGSWSRP
jgi:hypothetical protein